MKHTKHNPTNPNPHNAAGQAGRALLCCADGYWQDRTWFTLAQQVSVRAASADGTSPAFASLLLAHDGKDGDPASASTLLHSRPDRDTWSKTLAHLQRTPVGYQSTRGYVPIYPMLSEPDGPPLTAHSPKFAKACAYGATRVDKSYLV